MARETITTKEVKAMYWTAKRIDNVYVWNQLKRVLLSVKLSPVQDVYLDAAIENEESCRG